MELTDEAKDFVIEASYDVNFGARPMQRYLQRHLETLLAKAILGETIRSGDTALVSVENDQLVIKKK